MEVRILAPGFERRARVRRHVLAIIGSVCSVLAAKGLITTFFAEADGLDEILTEYLGWGYCSTSLCVALSFICAAICQCSNIRGYNDAIDGAFAVTAISSLLELSRYVERVGESDFGNPYLRVHASQFAFPALIAVVCLFLRERDWTAQAEPRPADGNE